MKETDGVGESIFDKHTLSVAGDELGGGEMAMFDSVVAKLGSGPICQQTHSEVERLVETQGRELMRCLLQDHLSLRARHEQERGLTGPVLGTDQVARTHQRVVKPRMMTLFGPVQVEQVSYQMPGVESLQPLEAMLNMPTECYSFGVSRGIAQEAAKNSFKEVVAAMGETNLSCIETFHQRKSFRPARGRARTLTNWLRFFLGLQC